MCVVGGCTFQLSVQCKRKLKGHYHVGVSKQQEAFSNKALHQPVLPSKVKVLEASILNVSFSTIAFLKHAHLRCLNQVLDIDA